MDSQDKNDSKILRRDEMLARRVGQALDRMKSSSADDCPDAAIIAAYAEQALEPAESAKWEDHFAHCAKCRQIVRVLAASEDTPLAAKEVAQLGKLVAAGRAAAEISGSRAARTRPPFVDWRTRWWAPALGVAAVLCVWLVMRPPWRATNRGALETLVAQAPKQEAPVNPAPSVADQFSRVAPQQDRKTTATPSADRSSANTQSLNSPVDAPTKRPADTNKDSEGTLSAAADAANSVQAEKKLNSLPDGREIQPPAIPPPPAAPPQAQAATGASLAPRSEARAELDATKPAPQAKTKADAAGNVASRDKEAAIVQDEASAKVGGTVRQQGAVEPPSNGQNNRAFAVFRPMQKYSSLLKAPSGSILWRAGIGGIIERSSDAGKTWISQLSPSKEDWLAGAAVSDTICWVAGRQGAIARTMDGEHWERMSPPGQAAGADAKLPDWTGIAARDAQSVTITASDGRKFATADGGKTWQLQ